MGDQKKIKPGLLIVEDDIMSLQFYKMLLQKEFNIYCADSYTSSIEKLNTYHFDIFLIDISINGDGNGLDVIRYLRKNERYFNVPIICLSAHVFPEDQNRAINAGADFFLSKPVDNKFLKKTLINSVDKLSTNLSFTED